LGTCVVRGLVDGHFMVWWVIDNVVWTDSCLSIASAGSPENHWVTRLRHKTEAEDSTRRCSHLGWFNRPGGAVWQLGPVWPPGSRPLRSFEEEDMRQGRKACIEAKQGWGRSAFVRWRKSEDFQNCPWGACIPSYLVRVVYSFCCPHRNTRRDGWQPTLGTLAHFLFSFLFAFSSSFSRTSLRASCEI
jgi:hypothetical protein